VASDNGIKAEPGGSSENVVERLRTLVRGRTTIDVAQFQFIGLEEIQRAYGDKWPEQKARIHDIAHGYIAKRIEPNDVLIRGADGFLLVSGSKTGRDAEVAALTLTQGLNEFFVGEVNDRPEPRFGVTSREVPANNLVESLGNLDFVTPAPAAAEAPSPEGTAAPTIEWRFEPLWDVRREALTSYVVVPVATDTGVRIPGYQFEDPSGRTPNLTALDEANLKVSEQAIQKLFASGKKALIGVSVHVSSLANNASRTRLFSIMEQFDRNLLRYKTLKIAGIAPGFPRLYLGEIMAQLKARMPNIVLGAAWDEPDVATLVQAGSLGFGFTLPRSVTGPSPAVAQATLLAKIRSAAEAAHAAKKPFFVEGAITPELAVRLCATGVDNMSSPLIWKPLTAPDTVVKWSADRLVK
jgi:hypothetical protein